MATGYENSMGLMCVSLMNERSLYRVSSKQARNTLHNNSISPTDIKMQYCLWKNTKFAILNSSIHLNSKLRKHGAWESAHYKVFEPRVSKKKLVATLKKFNGRHHDLVNSYNAAVSRIVYDVFANDEPKVDFQNYGHTLLLTFPLFRPMGMVGEACLPSNAYYPRTPDYTLFSGAHIC